MALSEKIDIPITAQEVAKIMKPHAGAVENRELLHRIQDGVDGPHLRMTIEDAQAIVDLVDKKASGNWVGRIGTVAERVRPMLPSKLKKIPINKSKPPVSIPIAFSASGKVLTKEKDARKTTQKIIEYLEDGLVVCLDFQTASMVAAPFLIGMLRPIVGRYGSDALKGRIITANISEPDKAVLSQVITMLKKEDERRPRNNE